jgi:glycosyltransferase involved in cell wall biosynthesis
MKILFPFVGDTVGGSHESAVLLIANLPNAGMEPVVVVHRDGPLLNFLAARGVVNKATAHLPLWERGGGPLISLFRILAITPRLTYELYRQQVDIVHVNDGRMAISWSLACRVLGIPLVVHQRTFFARSRISSLALNLASRVLVISQFTSDSLPPHVRPRVRLVANPLDTSTLHDRATARAEVAREFHLDTFQYLLIFVGTLQSQKRPRIALQALALLRQEGIDAAILVVGRDGGAESEAISAFVADAGLEEVVRLVGFRSDVGRLIAAADVLLAPAVHEGHGRVVLESMLYGTPVVAVASGGHVETIDHGRTGILVTPDDPQALANAVVEVLANPNRAGALVEAARKTVIDCHAVDLHVTQVVSSYRELFGPVAIVIESMGGGGAQQVASRLLSNWVDRGDRPALITFQSPETDKISVPEVIERHIGGSVGVSQGLWQAVVSNWRRALFLRQAIQKSQACTVVSFMTATNVLAILATVGLNVRIIVSERNDPARQKLGRFWVIMRRLTYPLAWRVTANTNAALQMMSGFVRQSKLVLVPNPLRPNLGGVSECSEPPFILAVGRLHPQKNYPSLLRAFAKADLPGWRLRILGDGPERDNIEALANQLGLSDRLDLLGYVRDPFPHYRAARIFIMVSSYEGSPNALWEAMNCALPTVISDSIVGALEVAENGRHTFVVPAGDELALSTALVTLASNKALSQYIGREAALLTKRFSSDIVFSIWDKAIFNRSP